MTHGPENPLDEPVFPPDVENLTSPVSTESTQYFSITDTANADQKLTHAPTVADVTAVNQSSVSSPDAYLPPTLVDGPPVDHPPTLIQGKPVYYPHVGPTDRKAGKTKEKPDYWNIAGRAASYVGTIVMSASLAATLFFAYNNLENSNKADSLAAVGPLISPSSREEYLEKYEDHRDTATANKEMMIKSGTISFGGAVLTILANTLPLPTRARREEKSKQLKN
jgi:hypothetical protein